MEWRKNPTPENHHALHTPWVDWSRLTKSKWHWPSSKLGYSDPDVLWSSLHAEFNCMPFAIQDPYAWHSDVCELAQRSSSKKEFEAALRERRDERFAEIRSNWEKTRTQLIANPIIWKSPPTGPDRPWATFCRISRHFSFDTIMGHFGNYVVGDPSALYSEEREARKAQSASAAPATIAAVEAPQQLGQTQQPTRDFTPSPTTSPPSSSPPSRHLPPAPAPIPAPAPRTKTRQTRVPQASKGPARRSRVEKPPPRRRTNKAQPLEGVRRSARLRERAGRGSG
ncbi:hypothetical protein F4823DRAFT_587952 [Ustulina deusta]|nr:hypothetical protein F4823DRAFT_587952 [Ustulina deusta]